MKQLYICEKKSLAEALAHELGSPLLKSGYYEVNDSYVAFLAGHILMLCMPADYDEKYKKYSAENLPIIPADWRKKILPGDRYKNILNTIKGLINQVEEIVNVGDPDREGHLLVQEVLDYLKCKKPAKRLLINAMDSKSIKSALAAMEDNYNTKYQNMYKAALARQRLDWMIGMNASPKYSLALQKTLRIGRVKAPTTALVIRRNEMIDNFKSCKYYIISGVFRPNAELPFSASWQPAENQQGLDSEGRLIDVTLARSIEQKVTRKNGFIKKIQKTLESESAPLPYSLSSLQSIAGKKYKINPKETLDTCQKLYEKKLTTYPRSDCNFLPTSQFSDASVIINNLQLTGSKKLLDLAKEANASLKSKAFNDKKIESHHAIIPTVVRVDLDALSEQESIIYSLIAENYLLQFYPEYKYEKTLLLIDVENETFKAIGHVPVENGWKAHVKNTAANTSQTEDQADEDIKTLPPGLCENQEVTATKVLIVAKNTKPLQRFTQTTLLDAMKQSYKYTKDHELELGKTLKDIKGIGTEATRATLISQLLSSEMLIEKAEGKNLYLYASDAAKEMIKFLPDNLTYPDETALMELELEKIVAGTLKLDDYMRKTEEYVKNLVLLPNPEPGPGISEKCGVAGKTDGQECPVCKIGKLVLHTTKNGKFWGCSRYQNGCKASFSNVRNKPVIVLCPTCKIGYLQQRNGKNGKFWACNNYPNCKATFNDEKSKPVFIKQNSKGERK